MEESIAYENYIQRYRDSRYNLPINVEHSAHTVCLFKSKSTNL